MHGFVTIECTFIFFDLRLNKFVFCRMTLGCIYLPGSHDGPAIADLLRKVFEKFGIKVDNIRVYVSDSGGGIPAAAKHLGILRDACGLHSLDTAVGHALGLKGKHQSPRVKSINQLVKAVSAQANVFKNATQRRAEYLKVGEELRAAMANNREGEARSLRRPMIVQLPGATRMWSTATTYRLTAQNDIFIDAYFAAEDPLNPNRLPPMARNEVGFSASMLESVAYVQKTWKPAATSRHHQSGWSPRI